MAWGRRRGVGAGLFPTMEYLKNTWLNSVSLSLTLLTHSLAWTGVWKLDPVFFFWMSSKCQHTHSTPPPLHGLFSSPRPYNACCWAEGPLKVLLHFFFYLYFYFFFFFFFASRHLTARHYIAPAPWSPSGFWGVWNAQSMQYSWTQICNVFFFFQIYCTESIFFLFVFFFSPFAF